MSPELLFALVAVFGSVAIITVIVGSLVLSWNAPGSKRLRTLAQPRSAATTVDQVQLNETLTPAMQTLSMAVPKSPKELGRLRRELTRAGYRSLNAAVAYSSSLILTPLAFAAVPLIAMGPSRGLAYALMAGMLGALAPRLWLTYRISRRQKVIQNGLPDALDLFIVCIEAGSSLDQAIVKTSEELAVSYPALAEELKLITLETAAGKPRLEAFKNFASRTGVDDVRALVAMLVQTDRFGTSIAEALRTHADTSRTKRRQRAEERAAKVGVKLIFPLVFCLFPAFFVVTLGPAVIQYLRVFKGQ